MPTTDSRVNDGLLGVQQISEAERIRIALSGEMDLANAKTAASILQEALVSNRDVVVDLTKLEFLDSTGIAILVEAMRDGGKRLSFLPSEHEAVRRLLTLTGLDERMNILPATASGTTAERFNSAPAGPGSMLSAA